MGNSNGSVNKGPFANWKTLEGHRTITRKVGAEGSLFNKTHLNDFMSFSDINNVLASSAAGDVRNLYGMFSLSLFYLGLSV
jgi:hypothetical protein